MIKQNQIARGVRVKLNSNFKVKCLGDKYLLDEPVLFLADEKPFNDSDGYYCFVRSGSLTNSGRVYLDEMDLEFPIPELPLYSLYDDDAPVPLGMNRRSDEAILPPHYKYQPQPFYRGDGEMNVPELEAMLREFKEYAHQQAIIKQNLIERINKLENDK